MPKLTIYGTPNSTFVRTTLMACIEKGIEFENVPVGEEGQDGLKSDAHMTRHPFGRIPAMIHDDVTLFETLAIVRYIDEIFDGPSLEPKDAKARAESLQWSSAYIDYMSGDMIADFILQFVFPKGPDGQPDMAVIDAARVKIRSHCEILDSALNGETFLAGGVLTMADLLIAPPLHYIGNMPGGMASFDGLENLGRWWQAISNRASFKDTVPPPLRK